MRPTLERTAPMPHLLLMPEAAITRSRMSRRRRGAVLIVVRNMNEGGQDERH